MSKETTFLLEVYGAGGAAFDGMTDPDILARALEEAARKVRASGHPDAKLYDYNGNPYAQLSLYSGDFN